MYQTSTGGPTFATFPTPQPSANITVNRGRVKSYGKNLYLKPDTNFEIELWNPKRVSVLAKIWINGNLISESGVIVRPGQRIYLDRFIDVAKKFKFSTYEIEDSNEARSAIADNGVISIKFFDEQIKAVKDWKYPVITNGSGNADWTWRDNYVKYSSEPSSFNLMNGSSTIGSSSISTSITNNPNYSCTLNLNSIGSTTTLGAINSTNITNTSSVKLSKSIETGRVETGEKSSQQFYEVSESYLSFACAQSDWKILPESQKPVEISHIRSYCTKCGTKQKSNWKFCPTCGISVTE